MCRVRSRTEPEAKRLKVPVPGGGNGTSSRAVTLLEAFGDTMTKELKKLSAFGLAIRELAESSLVPKVWMKKIKQWN